MCDRESSAEAGRRRGLHGAGSQRETLHLPEQPSGTAGTLDFIPLCEIPFHSRDLREPTLAPTPPGATSRRKIILLIINFCSAQPFEKTCFYSPPQLN